MPSRSASRAELYFATGAIVCGRAATSSADAAPGPSRARPKAAMSLDVRIGPLFGSAARVGDGAIPRRTHCLRVLPEITRRRWQFAGSPRRAAPRQLFVRELHGEDSLDRVDHNYVTIPQKSDRAAARRLRTDMADAETAGGAGESPVRDQSHLVAHALAVEGGRGGEHLPHAGTALRPLVADHQDLAFLVLAGPDRLE